MPHSVNRISIDLDTRKVISRKTLDEKVPDMSLEKQCLAAFGISKRIIVSCGLDRFGVMEMPDGDRAEAVRLGIAPMGCRKT